MPNKCLVVINESHKLLVEQAEILNKEYDKIEYLKVPASGWTLEDMDEDILPRLRHYLHNEGDIVFVSPIPYLIKSLSGEYWFHIGQGYNPIGCVRIFHNDKREKIELPNGKIIHKVADTGWRLV